MTVSLFFATARERYRMLLNKRIDHYPHHRSPSEPRQLTDDPIFQEWRFCNVFREDDKVTTWFRQHLRLPLGDRHMEQVRAAVVFRWFNNIATGEQLEHMLTGKDGGKWRTDEAEALVQLMADRGERILNPAYMIKSPPGMTKARGIFSCYRKLEDELELLTTEMMVGGSLEKAHAALCRYPYLGPFMAYQMICDLRFTGVLAHAYDINSWTAPGPGSARGCGRMFHENVDHYNYNSARDQRFLIDHMYYLLECSRDNALWSSDWPKWELSTVQHWCCEYDKYLRAKNGEGLKQRYRPA